jgi:hypothetical protein
VRASGDLHQAVRKQSSGHATLLLNKPATYWASFTDTGMPRDATAVGKSKGVAGCVKVILVCVLQKRGAPMITTTQHRRLRVRECPKADGQTAQQVESCMQATSLASTGGCKMPAGFVQ